MALSDLLWACPQCGEVGALRDPAHPGACVACHAVYERDTGASIRCVLPDGRVLKRTAADWVDRLPDPRTLLGSAPEGVVRTARVRAREVEGSDVVRGEGRYLNRIERYGAEAPGTLEMTLEGLRWAPDEGEARPWPFERLTAVQASSSALQIKASGRPLVSFRFENDSIFLWEVLVDTALRDFYRRTGRGEILEFQPRIVARR